MKLTAGNVFDKFLQNYKVGLSRSYILKPISWALYQTWEWADKNEKPKEDKDEELKKGST